MSKLKKFAPHKIWVVTGAASGIGLEMVRGILNAGAVVWALDVDETGLEELADEAKRLGQDIFTRRVDVTNQEQVLAVMDEITKVSKKIDVWINNAGVQKVGSFATQEVSHFNVVMKINFEAVVFASRELLKRMENQGGGVILNMASVAGHVPAPFMTAYVAAKHAVVGFSRALNAELQLLKSPVRCAMASPGFVDTKIIGRGLLVRACSESGGLEQALVAENEKGQKHLKQGDAKFPEWLSWMLAQPKTCAAEILEELAQGNDEIEPTLNGKAMTVAFKLLPKLTVKSSRVLLTRGFKDLILNRYHVPH